MQMLKKIFNSDSKYYLELDEALESEPVKQAVGTVKKAADVVQDKAAEALESKPVKQAVGTAKEAVDVAQDKLQSAVAPEAKSAIESTKKTVKGTKADLQTGGESKAQAQPSPKNSGASSFDPPFWVAAMYKNTSTAVSSDGTQAEQTFATDNLMPTITRYRRTPGPSLNKFKDMASKTKTPRG